ncbi:MAG: hypothetical protein L0Y72_09125 [Gemmataceae bacterium]|nr:hypothetical protein [Gemmataceae bacterium]MCI0739193.1 hypothetical protein [Gemmataceae bacterium]
MASASTEWAAKFAHYYALARQGDEQAQVTFVNGFGKHLLRVIRHRLNRRLRALMDSDDVLQEVWQKIFGPDCPCAAARSSSAELAYLFKIAKNITSNLNRKYLDVAKRDLHRETHFSEMPAHWDIAGGGVGTTMKTS